MIEILISVFGALISFLGLIAVYYELRSSKNLTQGTFISQLIDDLFSYRYSLAINNEEIQRISVIKYDTEYVNLYMLDKVWNDYRRKKGSVCLSQLSEINPNYDLITSNKKGHTDFWIRRAIRQDAYAIHDIMVKVEAALEDKSIYVCDDLEYVQTHVEKNGFGLVACNRRGDIVASFMFRYPGNVEDNLGRDIGLDETELDKVVHMESVVVLPEYRGNHLQEKMLRYAERLIDKDKYSYFLATVSPDNPASYLTFEKCGYSMITVKEKYNGLMRRIYEKRVS